MTASEALDAANVLFTIWSGATRAWVNVRAEAGEWSLVTSGAGFATVSITNGDLLIGDGRSGVVTCAGAGVVEVVVR